MKTDEVFQEWKKRKMGKIPTIKMTEDMWGCQGHVMMGGDRIGRGSYCGRYSHALSSAKRERVYAMARMMWPLNTPWIE
jgi:hypothetical protein